MTNRTTAGFLALFMAFAWTNESGAKTTVYKCVGFDSDSDVPISGYSRVYVHNDSGARILAEVRWYWTIGDGPDALGESLLGAQQGIDPDATAIFHSNEGPHFPESGLTLRMAKITVSSDEVLIDAKAHLNKLYDPPEHFTERQVLCAPSQAPPDLLRREAAVSPQ